MFNKNIKIAYFGTSEFSVIVLDELKKLGVLPDLVVTTVDKPVGRKMILTPNPTKIWAENNSVEYTTPEKLKDESFLKKISEYNLFIVASYGKIIPKAVIDMPKYHVLNVHPSLLPKYRGPSPLQEQIINNEKEVGVTIMMIDEQVDHGAIIAQEKVDIPSWPIGFRKLEEVLGKEGARIIVNILPDWIQGKIEPKEQDHTQASITKKIEKSDGFLVLPDGYIWERYEDYLKYLAYEEWPGTYFEIEKEGKKMRVIIKKASWKNDAFEIERVVPEGKKEMDYKDFLRGL
jgi:methionyl-tRNA formyltransferase